jgi:hypothetical protein
MPFPPLPCQIAGDAAIQATSGVLHNQPDAGRLSESGTLYNLEWVRGARSLEYASLTQIQSGLFRTEHATGLARL